MQKERVLIIGGGPAGSVLANLLPEDEFSITVIDKSTNHVFQPGQLFIAFQGSKKEFSKPIRDLLKRHVTFINREVVEVNLDNRYVAFSDGDKIDYDIVVIAAGVYLNYDAIPGHRDLLNTFGDYYSTINDARKLWFTLRNMKKGTYFIGIADPLYKCPPAPHKAAFLSSGLFKRVSTREKIRIILAVPFPHTYPAKSVSDTIEPKLHEHGVETITFFTVDTIDMKKKVISSVEGDEIKFDVATVVPITLGPKIKVIPQKVIDETNFIKVDKFKLNIEGYDDAYAIGDASNVPTSKSGVTAHLHAEVVSDRLQGLNTIADGRTHCPIISDEEGVFVISDYTHPPVPVKMSRFKRVQEDLFISIYWTSIKYPETMQALFHPYFNATKPEKIINMGW